MESQFVTAAGFGNLHKVRLLIDRQIDVNCRNSNGETALAKAAGFGHVAICEELIKKGAYVNCRDRAGATPLHRACGFGHAGVVRLLTRAGADVNAQDQMGNTPGHRAGAQGHVHVLEELRHCRTIRSRKKDLGRTQTQLGFMKQEPKAGATECLSSVLTDQGIEKQSGHEMTGSWSHRGESETDEQLLMQEILQKVERLAGEKQRSETQMQMQLDEKQRLISQLRQQIEKADSDMKEQLRQRDSTIFSLKQENKKTKRGLKEQIEQRLKEIEKLTIGSAVLRQRNEQLAEENEDQRKRVDSLARALKNAEAATEEAEVRLKEYEKLFRIPSEDIQVTSVLLGHGSYGEVRVAYWRGCPVAIKTFYKELTKERRQRTLLEQGISTNSMLNHPNIIKVCGVTRQHEYQFCLVTELLQGSLSQVIEAAQSSDNYLTIREQVDVAQDCLHGLNYLHQLQPTAALHGDIRPTNVLLTPTMHAKLCDLGAACFADADPSVGTTSPEYVANEKLADRTLPDTCEADIYSMGVTFCELFTGQPASRTARQRQLRLVSQFDLRDLCLRMTSEDTKDRIPACEALGIIGGVISTTEYSSCSPRRMVRGVMDGVGDCTLTDKPW